MLEVVGDLCIRLGLEVPQLGPEPLQKLTDISPLFTRTQNPVDIWGATSVRAIEPGYKEGMEAVLDDPNIDRVVPVIMLTNDTGVPSFDFINRVREKVPEKPILVTFSGQRRYMDGCKERIEPGDVPTFPQIEERFEVLSILARCHRDMDHPSEVSNSSYQTISPTSRK